METESRLDGEHRAIELRVNIGCACGLMRVCGEWAESQNENALFFRSQIRLTRLRKSSGSKRKSSPQTPVIRPFPPLHPSLSNLCLFVSGTALTRRETLHVQLHTRPTKHSNAYEDNAVCKWLHA